MRPHVSLRNTCPARRRPHVSILPVARAIIILIRDGPADRKSLRTSEVPSVLYPPSVAGYSDLQGPGPYATYARDGGRRCRCVAHEGWRSGNGVAEVGGGFDFRGLGVWGGGFGF